MNAWKATLETAVDVFRFSRARGLGSLPSAVWWAPRASTTRPVLIGSSPVASASGLISALEGEVGATLFSRTTRG